MGGRSAASVAEGREKRGARSLPPYAAGVVHFGAYDQLESCLESLRTQRHPPLGAVVIDHDADAEQRACRSQQHPEVEWLGRPNRGFAAGANAVLDWVAARHPQAQFALLLNPDVALDRDYAAALLRRVATHERVALASGKLLRPDGRTLDSAGIHMPRHRRPRDRGAEQADRQQYERCERVFAVTGAAMMIRRAALPDLEVEGEVFDEDFFVYHEDTDLGWRAGLLGWQALYVPEARAMHRRGWRRSTRNSVAPSIRRHSFKNHYLEMLKNERPASFLRDLPAIAGFEVLRLGFSLLRDRSLLRGYTDAARLVPRALHKRRIIQRRAAERRAT